MKLLFILSLLCINNVSTPCDTAKKQDCKTKPAASVKAPSKKTAKTPMPFYFSPVLVNVF